MFNGTFGTNGLGLYRAIGVWNTSRMVGAGMWVSRPGLGLETDQDHFCEVLVLVSTLLVLVLVLASLVLVSVLVSACLVLVLISEGGLEQDLRLCATATLLVSEVETSKWRAPLFTYLLAFPHLAVSNSYLIYTTTLRT